MLFDFPEEPTPFSEMLNSQSMDFSVSSLEHLNAYLELARSKGLDAKAKIAVCLRAGAYLGEVLRRNSDPALWHWLDFDNASKMDPATFSALGRDISTSAVLYGGNQGFCFPVGKVAKYLDEGSEHDTQLFAEVVIARWKQGAR